ncbi:hypothetical protein [Flagellimonas marinaquae]
MDLEPQEVHETGPIGGIQALFKKMDNLRNIVFTDLATMTW